jgi:hypothetical protein
MSLFVMFKEKAAELLQGAKDQVSELTGVDLPVDGVIDQVEQTAGSVTDAGQNLADTATGVVSEAGQTAGGVADAGQNLADTATGVVSEAGQTATGAVTDAADRLTGK